MVVKKWIKRWFVPIVVVLMTTATVIIIYGVYGMTNTSDDGQITVGFCADNLVIERWQRDQAIFVAKAMERDVEVIVHNANEDNETQNNQIRSLIEKNVDVIVVIPFEKDGLSESIAEARKAGIRVIAYDRLITGVDVDAYISFDNEKVGRLQAEALLENKPSGQYVIINGSQDDNNSSMFNKGYYEVLDEAVKTTGVRIIREIWAENWREEPAYDTVSELLEQGYQIDGIIGANDRLAEAAIRALAEEGQAGLVYVAGHDADISACQRIVEGTQHMTVYKPIRDLAETAVDLAIRLAKEETIHYEETINNGIKEVPYIKLDVLEVTAETMKETVIADGFHREEDIYRTFE